MSAAPANALEREPRRARTGEPLLEVRDLHVSFGDRDGEETRPAVDRVSFGVVPGELLALVGESGAGKSTTALAVLGLLGTSARVGGSVSVAGRELLGAPPDELRRLRGDVAALVPQDAGGSLDPLIRVGAQVAEQLRAHCAIGRGAARAAAVRALARAGLADPEAVARAYPHELSGGMRQRALIAMAISCAPRLLVCDEPTSALDRVTAARIVALLDELRRSSMGILLISHDLGVVAGAADRVAVMSAGRIVEVGPAETVLSRPQHPYTASLVAAVPWLAPDDGQGGAQRANAGGAGRARAEAWA